MLISGEGSNLQAFIDAIAAGRLPMQIAAVISDRPEANGLRRASAAGIESRALPAVPGGDRAGYDRELADLIDCYDAGTLLLAGFMRILGEDFVARHRGRMLNIHPSLLPRYRGLHTHRRVLAAGERVHGTTVHFVTEELDGGPAVLQARVPVRAGDDEATLSARVQAAEHIIFPRAAGWLATGRLRFAAGRAWLDDRELDEPVLVDMTG